MCLPCTPKVVYQHHVIFNGVYDAAINKQITIVRWPKEKLFEII